MITYLLQILLMELYKGGKTVRFTDTPSLGTPARQWFSKKNQLKFLPLLNTLFHKIIKIVISVSFSQFQSLNNCNHRLWVSIWKIFCFVSLFHSHPKALSTGFRYFFSLLTSGQWNYEKKVVKLKIFKTFRKIIGN